MQIERLQPPQKAKSYYQIKWNPVTKKYVQSGENINPLLEEKSSKNYHDSKATSFTYAHLVQNEEHSYEMYLRKHGAELMIPDGDNYGRTLLHCLGLVFHSVEPKMIEVTLKFVHEYFSSGDRDSYLKNWTRALFQCDKFGYSPLLFMLLHTTKDNFKNTLVIAMKELIRYGVLRTEEFLMGCGIHVRMTPKRTLGYKNRYLDYWWVEDVSYSAVLLRLQDLLEFVQEKDGLFESKEFDIYVEDYAFIESLLTDYSTDPEKNGYIQACKAGDLAEIQRLEKGISPGVTMEGIYQVCAHGHLPIIVKWVNDAKDEEVQAEFFARGFKQAICNGHEDMVKFLTENVGLRPDNEDYKNCVRHDRLSILLHFADLSEQTRSDYLYYALKFIAAEGKYFDFARQIVALEFFQLPDRFHEGDAIGIAYKRQNYELIDIICESRDVDEFTIVASYPIMLYAQSGHIERIQKLVFHPNFRRKDYSWDAVITEDEETAMFFACSHGNLELVKFFVQELGSKFQFTPTSTRKRIHAPKNGIHFAAQGGHLSVIEYILNVSTQSDIDYMVCTKGLDYKDPGMRSKYPYEFAQEAGFMEIAEMLFKKMNEIREREKEQGIPIEKSLLPDFDNVDEKVVEELNEDAQTVNQD